ncbi:hypothetical protein KC842_01725 [Candidatus Nomurabacteria bacterium]|nr:hypothetical protein [Candidatus Nomurabacteria bacterium]USN95052.1 MAG: hypothetical protein H6791_01315 [Candidatus Nomurabacteria bacterium]
MEIRNGLASILVRQVGGCIEHWSTAPNFDIFFPYFEFGNGIERGGSFVCFPCYGKNPDGFPRNGFVKESDFLVYEPFVDGDGIEMNLLSKEIRPPYNLDIHRHIVVYERSLKEIIKIYGNDQSKDLLYRPGFRSFLKILHPEEDIHVEVLDSSGRIVRQAINVFKIKERPMEKKIADLSDIDKISLSIRGIGEVVIITIIGDLPCTNLYVSTDNIQYLCVNIVFGRYSRKINRESFTFGVEYEID